MPTFILCNLAVSYLFKTGNPYLSYFNTDAALLLAFIAVILSLLAAYFKMLSAAVWYDLLACCILLTWVSYWQGFFSVDAPMFFFFPLFFAVMTAFVDLKFIYKRKYFDHDSIETIRFYSSRSLLHPALIIGSVLISILVTSHFILFPVLMNAYIVRYTLTRCLEYEA